MHTNAEHKKHPHIHPQRFSVHPQKLFINTDPTKANLIVKDCTLIYGVKFAIYEATPPGAATPHVAAAPHEAATPHEAVTNEEYVLLGQSILTDDGNITDVDMPVAK